MIGGLTADAMHDILEGVLQCCVKELLKVFIHEKKYFTLEEPNRRIAIFDFGHHNDQAGCELLRTGGSSAVSDARTR